MRRRLETSATTVANHLALLEQANVFCYLLGQAERLPWTE